MTGRTRKVQRETSDTQLVLRQRRLDFSTCDKFIEGLPHLTKDATTLPSIEDLGGRERLADVVKVTHLLIIDGKRRPRVYGAPSSHVGDVPARPASPRSKQPQQDAYMLI
jgi:hypothetical protein